MRCRVKKKRLNIPPGQLLGQFKHLLLANSCVLCACCIFDLNYGLSQLAVAGTLLPFGLAPPSFLGGAFFWGYLWDLLDDDLCTGILRIKPPVTMTLFNLPVVLIYESLHQV